MIMSYLLIFYRSQSYSGGLESRNLIAVKRIFVAIL